MDGANKGESEWVGGLVQVPAYATEDGAPYRPEALFWLDATGAVCAAEVGKPGELAALAADILEQTISKLTERGVHAPTQVRVCSKSLAAALRAALPSLRIVCAATPEIDELVDMMREQLSEDAVAEQSYLSGETQVANMSALFAAAAALYRAAPWQSPLPDDACIFVTIPQLSLCDAVLTFTGAPGRSPGVALLGSLAQYQAYRAALPLLARGQRPSLPRQLALNFERGAELSPGQRKQVVAHGWEVAGPDAYPWLVVLDEDLIARAPTPAEVALAEVLARALSELVENHRRELRNAYGGGAPLTRQIEVATQLGRLSVELVARLHHREVGTSDGWAQGAVAANTGMTSPLDNRQR